MEFLRLIDDVKLVIEKREFYLFKFVMLVKLFVDMYKLDNVPHSHAFFYKIFFFFFKTNLGMQNKELINMYQETIKTVEKYSNAFGVFMIGASTFIYSTSLLVSYWHFFTTENYKFQFNYPAS